MKLNIDLYQHFSFDLWLTIIKSNPDYKKKRDELLKDFFAISQPLEELQRVVRYYDVLCNNISEITGTHFNRSNIYLLILNKLNCEIESINNQMLDDFCLLCDELFFQYKPELLNPHLHFILNEIINSGKTANILSNTGFIHGETLRKILDYYELSNFFSFQLYSDETGFSKPNNKMFELVFDNAIKIKTINRNEIIHIGDNPVADFEGALNVGFQALLYRNDS